VRGPKERSPVKRVKSKPAAGNKQAKSELGGVTGFKKGAKKRVTGEKTLATSRREEKNPRMVA